MRQFNIKISITLLIILFVILQYYLWFAKDGLGRMIHLKNEIVLQKNKNDALSKRNTILQANISALKSGTDAIEQHARNDLGMIKKGEVFYQIVK